MIEGFKTEDEAGILSDDLRVPYYCIKLTPEQAKVVEGKIAGIYETDGHQMFKIMGKDKKFTGEKVLYVVWV